MTDEGEHAVNDGDSSKKEDAVFHLISLTGLVGDEGDDSGDDSEEEPTKAQMQAAKGDIPLYENAIEECFLLAVNSHDTPIGESPQTVWHWNDMQTEVSKVDMELEEESLRSWVPRPMFLPSWAVDKES